jgi:predicted membrane protein
VLVVLLTLFAIPCWALGLTMFGIPIGMALRRIGRDGYVSAMLTGAIGGFLAELVVVAVFGGVNSPEILLLYPAIMLIPGAVAGLIVRKVAYA